MSGISHQARLERLRKSRLTDSSRKAGPQVAVIDIGSNSVRLVVYEALTRALAPVFNEKVMCGLGREVRSTGLLAPDAVERALAALRRFHAVCKVMKVSRTFVIATAACRDATNGPDFIAQAERIVRTQIEILSGAREAKLSALGVISGVHNPNGIVGDLGGGSLELIDVRGRRVQHGETLPLGGLALADVSRRSIKRAERIVRQELAAVPELKAGRGRDFYAVGGTWRSLARLHIALNGYPLRVMHGYTIPAAEALAFARRIKRLAPQGAMPQLDIVAMGRRPLLAYAALVLEHVIRMAKPKRIVISTFGVREGLLFSQLPAAERAKDGLLAAAHDLNVLRSRSPAHADELIVWTDRFMRAARLRETPEQKRLRHAVCFLADIGWRAHPDYRGEQSLNLIANSNFSDVDHEGRVFLALAVFYRYAGANDDEELAPSLRDLASPTVLERAKVVGTALRIAHLVSAAQANVLSGTHFRTRGRKLVLVFERRVADLAGERVANRFKQLARLVGRSSAIDKL